MEKRTNMRERGACGRSLCGKIPLVAILSEYCWDTDTV
jgi:hypothetical protein